MTFGERRVGVDFNPSGSTMVDTIKGKAADLIDGLETAGFNEPGEVARLKVLARTDIESAAHWAVKASAQSGAAQRRLVTTLRQFCDLVGWLPPAALVASHRAGGRSREGRAGDGPCRRAQGRRQGGEVADRRRRASSRHSSSTQPTAPAMGRTRCRTGPRSAHGPPPGSPHPARRRAPRYPCRPPRPAPASRTCPPSSLPRPPREPGPRAQKRRTPHPSAGPRPPYRATLPRSHKAT